MSSQSKRATSATPRRDPKSGKWMFVFDSSHPNPDGSRHQVRRRGFETLSKAKDALDQARAKDEEPLGRQSKRITVGAVLDQYVQTKQLAGRAGATVASYRWGADIAKDRWGGWAADTLNSEHLEAAYMELMSEGRRQWHRGKGTVATSSPMSRRSVQAVHKTIKAAFQLAVDKGQIVRNPARLVTITSERDRAERPHWTAQEVGVFLDFMASRRDLPTGMVELLADTGARIGEVCGIHWSAVNLDQRTVAIEGQLVSDAVSWRTLTFAPTKRPRSKSMLSLHPATVSALRRRKRYQASERLEMGTGWPTSGINADLVFTWPDGSAIHPKTASHIIGRLSTQAGLPRLTAHGLRHSFATAALAARIPVEVVAARLGNTVRVVQEVYQHAIPAEDQAAAQTVGDLYRARHLT